MIRRMCGVILAILLLAGTVACGNANQGSTSDNVDPSSEEKTELVIAIPKDINGFDPNDPGNTLTAAVHGNMYEWLLRRDSDDNIVAGLADTWEQVDDVTWRFHLREGVTFHSGNPLTSEDVKFSLTRIQEDRFPQRSNYIQIKEVRVIDEHNFEIITDGPDPILLNRISRLGGSIFDSKLYEELGEEAFLQQVSGTGPYKLDSWEKDSEIVLVKNENYYGDTPKWQKVTFRVIPETSTRIAELLTGGVDVALDLSSTDVDRVNANEGTHIVPFTTKRVIYWVVRTSTEGLDDVKVRQAIDYAINDQLLLDTLYGGAGTVTQTIVAEGVFGSDPDLVGTYRYDPEVAKTLLAEAGAEGLSFELASGNGQYAKDKELTELVATMLVEAGFNPQVNIMDTSRFTELKNAREFYGLRMNGYSSSMSDAGTDLVPLTQENPVQLTDWHNEQFNALYAESLATMDDTVRQGAFEEMQQLVVEELPLIPMFQMPGFYGVSDEISYTPRADEYIYVDDITLAD